MRKESQVLITSEYVEMTGKDRTGKDRIGKGRKGKGKEKRPFSLPNLSYLISMTGMLSLSL